MRTPALESLVGDVPEAPPALRSVSFVWADDAALLPNPEEVFLHRP